MRIPGISQLMEGEESLLPTLFLLEGPLGVGKRQYCTQFLEDGISDNAPCILISARLTDNQFKDLFYKIDKNVLEKQFKFINPLLGAADIDNPSLDFVYQGALSFINLDNKGSQKTSAKKMDHKNEAGSKTATETTQKMIYVVVDSLNQLCDIFDVDVVRRFLARLTI